jgi:adenine-specific DNA-methyltransferase
MHQIESKELKKRLFNSNTSDFISLDTFDFYKTDMRLDELAADLSKKETIDIYDISSHADTSRVFEIQNRKYIGSKFKLIDFLERSILEAVGGTIESFFDCFAGTGIVSQRFRKYAHKVIANDMLASNHIIHKAFLSSTRSTVSIKKLEELCARLNSMEPKHGYVYSNFGNTYFTNENAGRIDAIREEIDILCERGECTVQEKYCLLASLLYSIDKVANTVGQYDAFLKHIEFDVVPSGRHTIDSNVRKPLTLKRPLIYFDGVNETYRGDIDILSEKINSEVVYIDPPYNSRQYIDCYHVLENIARWEKPATYGKTRKFERTKDKSRFSERRNAYGALRKLVEALKCSHLFLSYNTEGILTDNQILEILNAKGKVTVFEKEYPVFGNGAGVSVKRKLKERLFYCKVR